jgi:hypothetical protein
LGDSPDEISGQIAKTRGEIEADIVVLRRRGEVAVARGKRALLIAAGIGAAAAVTIVGAIVIYRMTRPLTTRERVERAVPAMLRERARRLRESWKPMLERVPSMRVAVGDKQAGENTTTNVTQRIALRVAQAAGTAFGAAMFHRLMSRFERKNPA